MRYYSSGKSHRNYKPRDRWLFSSSKKIAKRRYRQYENVGAIRYSNPFATKQKSLSFKWLKAILLPIFAIAWIGLLIYLPYFRVNEVSYSGQKIIKQSEMEAIINSKLNRTWPFPGNNYFAVSEKAISDTFLAELPLNSVSVTKIFPNRLSIVVQEKASSIIYDNGETYYLTDENGIGIKYLKQVDQSEYREIITASTSANLSTNNSTTTSSTVSHTNVHIPNFSALRASYGDYPIIYDTKHASTSDKATLIPKSIVRGIIDFYNAVNGGRVVQLTYFTLDTSLIGTTANTVKPWKIYFDPEKDIAAQVSNLKIILKNNQPTSYIDLRFGDRIYWK